MSFRLFGQIKELETGQGIPNVVVQAFDKDLVYDDLLGNVTTGADGTYKLEYNKDYSKGLFADKPDIYLVVKSPGGKLLKTTGEDIRFDVAGEVKIDVFIPRPVLTAAGLAEQEPVEWVKNLSPQQLRKFTAWTLRADYDPSDALFCRVQEDLEGKASVLELIKAYMGELRGCLDNNAPPFLKLAKLFDFGIVPEGLSGHHYGVPAAIRTGDQTGALARFGNILGFLWGLTLADTSPWVGKGFSFLEDDRAELIAGPGALPAGPYCLGLNYFNKIPLRFLNQASVTVLNWWMGLDDAAQSEKEAYGHEKNGGNFLTCKAPSVYQATRREVLQLNYRWKNLENPVPFRWLIDEVVQIAEGLYLGQLLYATKNLHYDYDPRQHPGHYRYQHFGYFLLFDEMWNPEARRLFPHLEVPAAAPGLKWGRKKIGRLAEKTKFSTFTLSAPAPSYCNEDVFEQVKSDLARQPSIIHLLKHYSDELQGGLDNDSPCFRRLGEIFARGARLDSLRGFYRGALVSWHAEGLLRLGRVNTINWAWMKLGRLFSPWTGKTFEDISLAKLKELTDGYETGGAPTFWGTNTQALRTPKEKFVGRLMKLAGVWTEQASREEAREFGYDIKCFFFISRGAVSVNQALPGKKILQINYRWPKLKTMPPDCYCIDELVQIAEGLYLGQLMYATELMKPYDPLMPPEEYKYRLFGYFLLMDEEWHQLRLDLGFDLGNV